MTVQSTGLTDAAVIEQSLVDGEWFGVLYDRYAAQLYRYAYRRLGSESAEDVVANTFLAAFRRRGSHVERVGDLPQ